MIIEDIKSYKQNDDLRIGIVCNCEKNYDFGLLYSYYCYGGGPVYSTKFFFLFDKDSDFVLPNGTIVAFLSKNDILGVASEITLLEEIPYLYAVSEDEEKIAQTRLKEQPYWEISYPWRFDYACLYFPVKRNKRDIDTLYYYHKVLKGEDNRIFMKLYALYKDVFCPMELSDFSDRLISIQKYVDNFSIEEALRTYRSGREGYFQSRPGRDDHFHTRLFKELDCDDPYVQSLVPIQEERDYYACAGRGIGDDNYYEINEEETTNLKNIALSKYDSKLHYAMLVSIFFKQYYIEKEIHENLLNDIRSFRLSDKERRDTFGYGTLSKEHLDNVIKKYNGLALEEIRKRLK